MEKRLSTIIIAYDQLELAKEHVRASMESTRVPDEIIVVNDGGDDVLKHYLTALPKACPLLYARITEDIPWNYTGARNLGFFLSRGDYISMEDTDVIPSYTLYEDALRYMKEHPEHQRVIYGKRQRVLLEDVVSKPREEWVSQGSRHAHQDTSMMKREVYMTIKGSDERFATRYAWASSDWRRRLQRAGFSTGQVSTFCYMVQDGETHSLVRRKSYKNYEMARERDGHIQSKWPLLNFSYEFHQL